MRALFLLVAFCAALHASAARAASFAGTWSDAYHEGGAFILQLTQAGNRVRGYHVSVAARGKRIDAALPEDGPPSITGTISAETAHVHFRSGYRDDGSGGEALLTFRGDKLEWKIIKSSGAHYFPKSAILSRQRHLPLTIP